jgi:DNA-binding MarR family transcriptional regulator
MEAAGMVARAGGAKDRRTTQVRLTGKGRALLARATPLAVHNAALLAERLSEDERAQLHRLLRKARADDALPLSKL